MTKKFIKDRFDGNLPVVIDVETGGVNASTDALLEIAAVFVDYDAQGKLELKETVSYHIEPFKGGKLHEEAMRINGIDPDHPFRFAVTEKEALTELFKQVKNKLKDSKCKRAILVGHNAHFDLGFLTAAVKRCKLESPFHSFSCLDTATIGGIAYGKTVLAKALKAAGIPFDKDEAHSAVYDAEQTAKLFCQVVNKIST